MNLKSKYNIIAVFLISLVLGLNTEVHSQSVQNFIVDVYNQRTDFFPNHTYLGKEVSLKVIKAPIRMVLKKLEKQTHIQFIYGDEVLETDKKISVEFKRIKLNQALKLIFDDIPINYITLAGGYVVLKKDARRLMQGIISGTVTDSETGETLPGANVALAGTTQGASTDANGEYIINNVEPGSYTIRASFIGFQASEQQIIVEDGETLEVNFALAPSAVGLEELIVVGYGTQTRGQLTGSVSRVNMEDVANAAAGSFEQSLQGRVAGVRVVQAGGGKPGGALNVRIRGLGTVNSESPLYVIDGVPVQGVAGDQLSTGILNTLNPNDIATIDILKDASAAAIYGSRASGGVVLITTKKGSRGAVQVNFESSYGTSNQPKRYDVLNADQYAEYLRDLHSGPNSGELPDNFEDGKRPPYNTDWQDALFRPAPLQNYNLAISGGGETSTYSIGLGYYDETGTMVGSEFQRYSLRANTRFPVNDHIEIGGSLLLGKSDIGQNDQAGGRRSLEHAMKQAPTVPVYDDSFVGGFGWPVTADGQDASNPVANGYLRDNTIERYSMLGSIYGEVDFLHNFTYKLQAGFTFRYADQTSYNDFYETTRRQSVLSSLTKTRSQNISPLIEQTLNYVQTIGNHDFSILAGFSAQSFRSDFVQASGTEMPVNVRSLSAATSEHAVGSGVGESSLRSLFGRITYSYDNKYLFTGNIRRDESSKLFNATEPVGIFPSVSVGWRISEEPFLANSEVISHLKLRAGWGQLGNQSVLSNYPTAVNFSTNYYYVFGNQVIQGIGPQDMANRDITWETSIQTDIGVEVGLFNDMLSLDIDYYNRTTEDLLWTAQVPPSVGLNPPFINAGMVVNNGIEFAAGYSRSFGDVSVNLSGNFTTINNEVKSLGANDQVEIIRGNLADDLTGVSVTRVGDPIGQFYGYVTDGLFQSWDEVYSHALQNQALLPNGEYDVNARDNSTRSLNTAPGDIRFVDLNGDGVINDDDKTIIGNPIPDFTYGFTADLAYKNFDFNVFIQGTYGNDILNGAIKWLQDFRQNFNQGAAYLDHWTPENTSTEIPRSHPNDPNSNISSVSDRYVEDGSYLRVKTVTIGYTFNNDFINQVGLRRFRVYATARNLFTITGYSGLEPEIGSLSSGTGLDAGLDRFVYPQPRQFLVGLQLGF